MKQQIVDSFFVSGEITRKRVLDHLDLRGHKILQRGNPLSSLYLPENEDISRLAEAMRSGIALTTPVLLDPFLDHCYECGQYLKIATDGLNFWVADPCECPEEGPIEFELNVPSGSIVYADNLSPAFHVLGMHNINTRLGLIRTTLDHAAIGCAHGYVGNSCPGIYQKDGKGDRFVIGDRKLGYRKKHIRVGSICTDLWWYSLADADEFFRRGGTEDMIQGRFNVVPGVYKFSHTYGSIYAKGREQAAYAAFKKVREPDPVKDYLESFRALNLTAGQVAAQSMKRWPTLYGGPDGVQRVADQTFVVIGGCEDWHPNGFPIWQPDNDSTIEPVEIPKFDKSYKWYPVSKSCAAAVYLNNDPPPFCLNESMVDLLQNVLENMATHGNARSADDDTRTREFGAEHLEKFYVRFPERRPTRA